MSRASKSKQPATRKGAASKQELTAATLEARAEEITSSLECDTDTRYAVNVALSNFRFRSAGSGGIVTDQKEIKANVSEAETELRELIRKAEAGEPVFDEADIGKDYVSAARLIYEAIEASNKVPQFVYDAITTALTEAERKTGAKLWIDDEAGGGYSIQRLARFFKHHSFEKIELEPKKDLAQMISEVWNHPECPAEIKEALNAGTSDLFNVLPDIYKTADYVRALIKVAGDRETVQ